jgi:hypothetical protein
MNVDRPTLDGALAIALVPLAIYGAQDMLGYWPESEMGYRDYHYRIVWQRHEVAIAQQLRAFLPEPLRELFEQRAA